MAESVTFNNAVYIIPDVGESNWGQNLTNYFVAIPQGCYQLSGGTAPLTADLSFGTNFGLFAKYLTSTTTHPAGTGSVRLANTDSVSWRNAANSADLPLSVDTSNNLLWNGDIVATSAASPVLSITGTANQVIASSATGNVTLSLPQSIATSSTPTFGGVTISGTSPKYILSLSGTPQAELTIDSNDTYLDYGGTIGRLFFRAGYNGTAKVTFDSSGNILANGAMTLSPTTNQIVLGTTHTVTISSTAPTASRTYTIPDAGGAANFLLSGSGQIVNADISASAAIAFSKLASLTSANILVGSAGNVATAVSVSGDVSLSNSGAVTLATVNTNVGSFTNASITVNGKGLITAASNGTAPVTSVTGTSNQITSTGGTTPVVALASPLTTPGAATITGNLSFDSSSHGIVGITGGGTAASGNVGQRVSSTAGFTNFPTTTQWGDLTNISLTAGDWDITVQFTFYVNSSTTTVYQVFIGTVSGNSGTGNSNGDNAVLNYIIPAAANGQVSGSIANYQVTPSSTTTYYLKYQATYSLGTPQLIGRISARRMS